MGDDQSAAFSRVVVGLLAPSLNLRPVHPPEASHTSHVVPVVGELVPSKAVERRVRKDVSRRREPVEEGALGPKGARSASEVNTTVLGACGVGAGVA